MELIAHRINSVKKLKKLPKKYGAEIDLRSNGSNIILNHDPHKKGEKLKNFLSYYNHGTLILNIKESGIENEAIKISKKFKIRKFFLLDVEMPFICKNKKNINKSLSVRYSEYESIDTVKKFINNVGWVWIDTFNKLPINKANIKVLKKFKTCLVCPERWNRPQDISLYYKKMKFQTFFPNLVMTSQKNFSRWEKLISKN